MKFLLGLFLLTAATSTVAESYNGAPYPTLNGGVPDHGSDGYRQYRLHEQQRLNDSLNQQNMAAAQAREAEANAQRRHNELMQQLQQLQSPAQEEGWRPR